MLMDVIRGDSMPTPSDPTAVPARSYEEMVRQGQVASDEAARAIDERKAEFEQLQQAVIPNRGVPPVIGDCILDK
jgi:hypothetical protein